MNVSFGPYYFTPPTRPGSSITNSVTTDQDIATICTFDANLIKLNTKIEVELGLRCVSGTSSTTFEHYLKLGGVKVYTYTAGNLTDGRDISVLLHLVLTGTAAPGASVSVECMGPPATWTGGGAAQHNITPQPVAGIDTSSPVALVLGGRYSSTGSTEVFYLLSQSVRIINP
jgi:hypothetical protein